MRELGQMSTAVKEPDVLSLGDFRKQYVERIFSLMGNAVEAAVALGVDEQEVLLCMEAHGKKR